MVNMRDNESSNDAQLDEPLGRVSILSYGSGHMLNDITSSCWFTYLLVFLTDLGLSPGYVLSGLHLFFSDCNAYDYILFSSMLLKHVKLEVFMHSL
jgi:hypothetical protein